MTRFPQRWVRFFYPGQHGLECRFVVEAAVDRKKEPANGSANPYVARIVSVDDPLIPFQRAGLCPGTVREISSIMIFRIGLPTSPVNGSGA